MQTPRTAALLAAGLLGAALALPARAADASALVAPAFGNTVMSIYPDGRSQKIWLHPDGTWDGKSRRGNPLAGKWNVKNDKVCLKQSKPPVGPFAFCQPFPAEVRVGVAWTSRDMTGTPIQIKIVRGLVEAQSAN